MRKDTSTLSIYDNRITVLDLGYLHLSRGGGNIGVDHAV